MSVRNKPYRDKDKRSLLLEKESEKLRREITELEDALILHSRYEGERDQSVRGLIRKELGGSHWEYGGEGKMRTFRSQKDLSEDSKRNGKETHQGRRSRRRNSHTSKRTKVPKSLSNALPIRNVGSSSPASESSLKESSNKTDIEISCIKAEWNLSPVRENSKSTKDPLPIKDLSVQQHAQEENSIRDLKSKVLAKATAKILNKSVFPKTSSPQRDISHNVQNISPKSKPALESHPDSILKLKTKKEAGVELDQTFCGKKKFNEGANERENYEKAKSYYHQKSKVSVTYQSPYQDKPTHLSKSGNIITKKDSMVDIETKGDAEDYSNSKITSNLNNTSPQFLSRNSSVLDSHSTKFNKSENMLTIEPVMSMQTGRNDDVQNGKTAGDKSPPIDEEVLKWLQNLGLHATEDYVDLFARHQMDMASVKLLTSTQLREMGIHALGPIMKIIKGVQILARRNSIDDVDQRATTESRIKENKNGGELTSSHKNDVEALSSGTSTELKSKKALDSSHSKNEEDFLLASLNDHIKKDTKSLEERNDKHMRPVSLHASPIKKSFQSTEAKWKKTFDEAEFLNLNDRSPIADLNVPLTMTVQEKETPSKHAKSQKKSEQPKKIKTKSSRKPPPMTSVSKAIDDGITSAAQKYTEKQKQQNLKEQAEGRTTARRREQKRNEMASRHHIRQRSSSLDRDLSPSTPKPSLQRSTSFTNKDKKLSIGKEPSADLVIKSESIKKVLEAENSERRKDHTKDEMKMEEIITTMKALPEDGLKTQDENQLLTLGVVRELQKQLNDLEQHLVQTKESECIVNKACPEEKGSLTLNGVSIASENHEGPQKPQKHERGKDCNNETLSDRKSARERRREKQSVKTCESHDERHMQTNSSSMPTEAYRASIEHQGNFKAALMSDDHLHVSASIIGHRIPLNVNATVTESHTDETTTQGLKANSNDPKVPWKYSQHTHKPQIAPRTIRPQSIGVEDRLNKIEIDRKDITYDNKDLLGEGVFSQVFEGKYQGSQVAIKLLRAPLLPVDKNYFSAEVSLLQELRHPHVVMLLGVCTSRSQPVMVLELMEGGNLFDRLHDQSMPHLSKSDVYQISHDVASGVSYLHHHRPPVLHLDLKSRNILLGFRNRAKIADFGFSKLKHEADIKVSRASKPRALSGSPAWMAPELLAAGEITAKADVYSFAIALWEMITRKRPYEEFSMFQILEHVRLNKRPQLPSGYPATLIQLITKCWDQNPAARPGFKDILKSLEAVFSDSEMTDWPEDPAFKELDAKPATSQRSSFKKENINAGQRASTNENVRKEVISQEEEAVNLSTNSWDDMDVRSISPDNIEYLEHDKNDNSNTNMNNIQEKQENHKEEHLLNTFHKKTDKGDEHLSSNTCPEKKLKESSERLSISQQECHTEPAVNKISTLPMASPQLVSSPRIREIAKKQAVERSSSVFLSKISDQSSDIKTDSTSIKISAVYPHEDEKLETLMQKYLPSPRNKALIKQRPATHDGSRVDKLLPLRQSLNKPSKPPKPNKPQNLSAKSLNFDVSSTPLERASQFESNGNQFPKQRPKITPRTQPQSQIQGSLNKSSEDLVNKSLIRASIDREEGKVVYLPSTDIQQYSHSAKEQQHHLEDSYTILSKSLSEIKSSRSLTSFDIKDKSQSQEEITPISPITNVKISFGKGSPSSNTYNSHLSQNTVKSNEFGMDESFESKKSIKSEDFVEKGKQNNTFSTKEENATLSESENVKGEKALLPFLSELVNKSTIKEANELSDDNERYLNSHSKNFDAPSVSIPQLNLECFDKTDRDATSIDQSNMISPASHQPFKLESQHNTHSDSESSISTEFSADSLSVTLSDDDDDSINSFRVTGSVQTTNKSSRNRYKGKNKHADEVLRINTMSSPFQSPVAHQEGKHKQHCVRESFFLFDDFQLANDSKESVEEIGDENGEQERMNNYCKPSTLPNINEISSDPSTLNVNEAEFNSSLSNLLEKKRQQKVDNQHRERNSTEKKSNQPKISPDRQKIHRPRQMKRLDDKSNLTVEGRPLQPQWPAPPVSHDEPNMRPLRTVQFSLEASMLINQKKQLKSVAVLGDPPAADRMETNKSMPSVANILKKAIEERRFALGDNLESQDITPEASWSIQD